MPLASKQPVKQYDQPKECIAEYIENLEGIPQQLQQKLMPLPKRRFGNTFFPFCENIDDIVVVDKDSCR